MINPYDLIDKFAYSLDNGWGYIYATAGEKWTQAKQNSLVQYFITKYGANWKESEKAKNDSKYRSAMYGAKWIGHYVADCSGMFTWAFKELGSYMYHGSNTMYNKYCTSKGKKTDGIALKPGTAVFTGDDSNHGHVGLFIGNNTVIEAQGTQAGVTTTKLTNTKWTYWGELKDVDYGSEPSPTPTPTPGEEAVVVGKQVALRYGPTTDAPVILRVATGETVKLTDPPDDWIHITFNGKSGYMMKKFLNLG